MTPPMLSGSETYRADRRRDPTPINNRGAAADKDRELAEEIVTLQAAAPTRLCLLRPICPLTRPPVALHLDQ
jgi:hypothetical protein